MTSARKKLRRLAIILLAGVIAAAVLLGRPILHLVSTAIRDHNDLETLPPGFSDDASRLNRTAVAEVVPVEKDPAAAEVQLAGLLERARNEGLHATREQFRRAYPQAAQFFALKRRYDPDELFQNQFYLKYNDAAEP
jgi:hypothetical protein